MPLYLLLFTLLVFGIFLLVYRHNKARLASGALFSLFLLSAGVTYMLLVLQYEVTWLYFTLFGVAILAFLVLAFGVYVLIAGLLLNARLLLKRERRTLQNSLTGLFGLALVLFLIASALIGRPGAPHWLQGVWAGLLWVVTFYFAHVFLFLVSALLCNFARPHKNQNYLIVLGARLVDGKPSPLLARRIDKAIAFYRKQAEKTTPPKLVMSGGQGRDEPLAESAAMRAYALEQGIPAADILVEDRSKNTYENMAYSKKVMNDDANGKPYRCIFATNNYHVFRSAIMARKNGLAIDGIGCKTALYYLPNALLREYLAFLSLRKKAFAVLAGLLFVAGAGLYFLNWYIANHYVFPA